MVRWSITCLEDAYDKGKLMGAFAEDCAEKSQFTREAQDAYAIRSLENAQNAQADGKFANEISPVSYQTRKGELSIESDEQPRNAMPEKIPNLKPAFKKDGTVTAANASSISDGAAALVLTTEEVAKREGLEVRAVIHGHASHAQEPGWFTTAPVPAAKKLMEKIGWTKDDVDLWEVNEAFAVVPMAFMHEFGLGRDTVVELIQHPCWTRLRAHFEEVHEVAARRDLVVVRVGPGDVLKGVVPALHAKVDLSISSDARLLVAFSGILRRMRAVGRAGYRVGEARCETGRQQRRRVR